MERGVGGHAAWAYFLRADTMHSLYTYLEQNPGRSRERFHELSHGEGFLEILSTRANQRGFYLMDEPDAPLSFIADLSLVALLHQLAAQGSQMIVVTHSPVIAAAPGAHILELGGWGFRPARWEDLELVHSWRGFLSDPALYLSHLLSPEDRRECGGPGRRPGIRAGRNLNALLYTDGICDSPYRTAGRTPTGQAADAACVPRQRMAALEGA